MVHMHLPDMVILSGVFRVALMVHLVSVPIGQSASAVAAYANQGYDYGGRWRRWVRHMEIQLYYGADGFGLVVP